ncbi:MAG: hypothetical protein JSS69_04165 [Acidobacteria bacterium]|nr:hypothetical protein [Acidobacteriota bacterium]MBS1865091.1 hypothetical protein [Acidobacteriota bacterium]
MKLDSTQRTWLFISIAIFVACLAIYVPYALTAPKGPTGGSALGLAFGIVGFAFMLFAAALGARKRVPTWRLGRAQAWMRGHLWLGFLALPLILFHGGFHFGGTLTRVLMWLLIITVVSGVFGAALQNYLPKIMTNDVPLETIYDEIGHVRRLLREEADRAMESLCGPLGFKYTSDVAGQRAGGFTAMRALTATTVALRTSAAVSAGASVATAVAAAPEIILLNEEQSAPLRRFYLAELRPYLEQPKRSSRLSEAGRAKSSFAAVRTLAPASAHATITDLEEICEEARQLSLQERMHRWLHGWLLVHIPLSLALILLGAVHAVMALRY